MAWDVDEGEDPAIAADLVSWACLNERVSKGRKQPLILHADNGNAMPAATMESRLEILAVLRSFSRPRVSNDNPHSESLFRKVKYWPDYNRKPFSSKEQACRRLVQPPASSQRDQFRDTRSATQQIGYRHLKGACEGL